MTIGSEREAAKRGTNRRPPRRHKEGWWVYWCGWCRKDHKYGKRYTQEQVIHMHKDRMEHICKVRAHGEDPFG